ncbi:MULTISPECIES: tRNA (adenosine(37)-N6)-threonylcarbamoyltransferase complex ATPase subunit type 1 TsaE [unclassified Marinobacterium]|uniref:tRNA (adenosine(37)-N6)-threonylcarbamoyltransferase complex ATPase subunit type 1 TsaE n=1 Tax=unclassified Marinobacterium TaxID=2644139 RepID=UPI0015697BEB|nr:tRNA threonylcarbamoyladenosine biosynthesis protein TsaE [Marinobacterium sp. xm-a-152]NRP28249.1 tRNA threonylcarbamoyladenosine biosynthesis protein TsaE [Marinobacterium sp. xm-d-420]NRP35246.1 tRNA threonylcarbamoyladenosine biosynthesis protein TsaE [Marinobacterium sp. xm-d-579]NRP38011.1 tRNA threonylcarbamoyladenosine biosynthesis protein TsaE [Marinobacterium sp. xm-a-121]NRP53728.1 tRNA threonylcarbamoyladenosine biosynthesis protein TsaE [Marinobacterium sp. xm-v-242]NRP56162.1 
MTQSISWSLADEAETIAAGALISRAMSSGVLFLHGNLGMGKTTLARGVIQSLGHQGAVKSPTYTLVEPYEFDDRRVYHFDLYRLGDPEELEYMGIRDYFENSSLCLVEWSEKGEGFLPAADLDLFLEPEALGRKITIYARTELGQSIVQRLQELRSVKA